MLYDVFISHASEDKESFVRTLAESLKDHNVEVQYDEFSLKLGDSLRQSIDQGLVKSRFGIVILSPAFFAKKWPQWELNGLVAREIDNKGQIILPIWHNVEKKDVLEFSPSLADKVGVSTEQGLEFVVNKLLEVIQPQGSTLIKARDTLILYGFNPPVVTDDWWLNVVEFSGSDYWHNHWGFSLPYSEGRSVTLAFAAMQISWQAKDQENPISQITSPKNVLDFIEAEPGLKETCFRQLTSLAAYTPQLTLPGFGGLFEEKFEAAYQASVDEGQKERNEKSSSGTALTINNLPPVCSSIWALRHPNFGDYKARHIVGNFVQGQLMGEHTRIYEIFDYLIWFLSDASDWFPNKAKKFLIKGFKEWQSWSWDLYHIDGIETDLSKFHSAGFLFEKMFDSASPKRKTKFKLTKKCINDIQGRITIAVEHLGLPDNTQDLLDKFIAEQFIEDWIEQEKQKRKKHKY